MAGVLYRQDGRGHGILAQWGDDRASQAKVQQIIDDYTDKKCKVADLTPGPRQGEFIERFDPTTQTELLVVAPMVGG